MRDLVEDIRDWCRVHVQIRSQMTPPDWAFSCMEQLLLENGEVMVRPAEVPERWRGVHMRSEPRECFANAMTVAHLRPGLTYCEGLALPDDPIMPVHHAWLVTERGEVIDPTWTSHGGTYLGVRFRADVLLRRAIELGVYAPALDCYQDGHAILREPGRLQELMIEREQVA